MARDVAMRALLPFVWIVVSTVVCPTVLGSLFVDPAPQCLRIEGLAFEHRLSSILLLMPTHDLDVRTCLKVDRPRVFQRVPAVVVLDELATTTGRFAVLAIGIARGRHVTLPCARLALLSW